MLPIALPFNCLASFVHSVQLILIFIFKICLSLIFRLWWIFVAAHALSVAVVRGCRLLEVASLAAHHGLSVRRWQLQRVSSALVHGLGCSAARGIFLDQGSNWCIGLHCKVDSQLLDHQGNLDLDFLISILVFFIFRHFVFF